MAIEQSPILQHWNYFLALEDDVERLSRYLELTKANFSAYSLELARVLFASASEVDVVAKLICKQFDEMSKAQNISEYRNEIILCYPEIASANVLIPKYGLSMSPWEAWGKESGNPAWWKAYNDVKHNRDTKFFEANLKNTLNAIAALFVLLLIYYIKSGNGIISPDPYLFRIGDPFLTDRPMYDQHSTLYILPSTL